MADTELRTAAGQRSADRRLLRSSLYLLLLVTAVAAWFTWTAPTSLGKGSSAAVLLLSLMLLRVPIGISMAVAGTAGLWSIGGARVVWSSLGVLPFGSVSSFTLSVLPMFVLMGLLLWRSGVTERLYAAARVWIGWLPGGLAVTTNMAGAGMAAASGSTLGITYALGRIAIPEMLRSGYDRRLAVGSVMTAGTIGQLIPPSILLVIYAGIAQTPVGPQLLAGVVPGVLLTIAYCVLIVALAAAFPSFGSRPEATDRVTWRGRMTAIRGAWPVPVLVLIVLGGLYGGAFTATEAGAFGAAGAILVALQALGVTKGGAAVLRAAAETVVSVAAILFLLVGAAIFTRMLALSGVAREIAEPLAGSGLSRLQIVLVMVLVYFVLGMFLEPVALILLTVPILMPVVEAAGISLIWYGVFVVLMAEVAVITPPVGILAFVVHRIAQEPAVNLGKRISLPDVFAGGLIFIPMALTVLLLLTLFPELVEFLPSRTAE